ncbi:hypothetical protein [Candidatus Palauibacter sp.]|uniref:hypothetical protein n=1 Tax=Candidatus Palauibacter sp. TaxID=3101350 RepID=UPI003AF2B7F2
MQIESVTLAHAELKVGLDPLDMPEELRLSQRFRCRCDLSARKPDHAFVYIDLMLDATSADDAHKGQSLFGLSATFLAIYRLEGAAAYPTDSLEHFAELNGTYNVWPYWREFVQTAAARAGLASIVVPVFRPQVQEIEEQGEISFDEASQSQEATNSTAGSE